MRIIIILIVAKQLMCATQLATAVVNEVVSTALRRVSGSTASLFQTERTKMTKFLDPILRDIVVDDPACPPRQLHLANGEGIVELDPGYSDKQIGSKTKVFFSTNSVQGHRFAVKLVNSRQMTDLRGLVTEVAFMRVACSSSGAPRMFDIEEGHDVSEQCRGRLVVTEFAGTHTLKELASESQKTLARVGARMLELIRNLHKDGFVHGDVHEANFVYMDPSRVVETMRIIDFGRSDTFLDHNGAHIPFELVQYSLDFAPYLLSPWELRNEKKTRRDDLFRVAETLLIVGGHLKPLENDWVDCKEQLVNRNEEAGEAVKRLNGARARGADSAVIERLLAAAQALIQTVEEERWDCRLRSYKLKVDPPFPESTPQIFKDLYQACRDLEFDQTIDYDQWIQRLVDFADSSDH